MRVRAKEFELRLRLFVHRRMFTRFAGAIASRDDALLEAISWPMLEPCQEDSRWDAIVGAMRRR